MTMYIFEFKFVYVCDNARIDRSTNRRSGHATVETTDLYGTAKLHVRYVIKTPYPPSLPL